MTHVGAQRSTKMSDPIYVQYCTQRSASLCPFNQNDKEINGCWSESALPSLADLLEDPAFYSLYNLSLDTVSSSEAETTSQPSQGTPEILPQNYMAQAEVTPPDKKAVRYHTSTTKRLSNQIQKRRAQNRTAQRSYRRRQEQYREELQDRLSDWQQKHRLLLQSYNALESEVQCLKKEIAQLNDKVCTIPPAACDSLLFPLDFDSCPIPGEDTDNSYFSTQQYLTLDATSTA